MNTPNLTFNLLTFTHSKPEFTFYFTDKEQANLTRIFHTLVPGEVIEKFGEQEHYYTSFETKHNDFSPVTKPASPAFETLINEDGEEKSQHVHNSTFSSSVLKRY